LKNRSFKDLTLFIFKLTKEFIFELLNPKISFYAASMSWATLFFIIPMLVITLSIIIHTPIFKGYYLKIHNFIASSLVPTSSEQIMQWVDSFVANASQMGYVGVFYVVVAAVLFFKDYDYIVNDIFNNQRRGLLHGLLVYGTMILFMPLSLAATIWLTAKLNNHFHLTPLFLQFIMIWAIVFIIYKISPKEKIPLNTTAISSFVATLVWFVAKSIFIFYILYNKTYTTIYGTVSIVLFTFLWIYISWTIFLHGLQLCKMLLDED